MRAATSPRPPTRAAARAIAARAIEALPDTSDTVPELAGWFEKATQIHQRSIDRRLAREAALLRPRGSERSRPAGTVRSARLARGRGTLRRRARDPRGTPPADRRARARPATAPLLYSHRCADRVALKGISGTLASLDLLEALGAASEAESSQQAGCGCARSRPGPRCAWTCELGATDRRPPRRPARACAGPRTGRPVATGHGLSWLDLGSTAASSPRSPSAAGTPICGVFDRPRPDRPTWPVTVRWWIGANGATLRVMDVSRAYTAARDRLRPRQRRRGRPRPAHPAAPVRRRHGLVHDARDPRQGHGPAPRGRRPVPADGRRRRPDPARQRLRARLAAAARACSDAALADALTIVYRILFLLFAEARGLVPQWHPVYRDSYTIESLRPAAEGRAARRALVRRCRRLRGSPTAAAPPGTLRVVPFNGRLFAPAAAPLADSFVLDDRVARDVLLAVTTRPAADRRERITYADLGVEQLGAVYERVLDYAPSVAGGAVTLMPSGRRKDTGTFYTPRSMTGVPGPADARAARARPHARRHPVASRRGSRDGQRRVPGRGVPLPGVGVRRRDDCRGERRARGHHGGGARRLPPRRRPAMRLRRRSEPDGRPARALVSLAVHARRRSAAHLPRSSSARRKHPGRGARDGCRPAAARSGPAPPLLSAAALRERRPREPPRVDGLSAPDAGARARRFRGDRPPQGARDRRAHGSRGAARGLARRGRRVVRRVVLARGRPPRDNPRLAGLQRLVPGRRVRAARSAGAAVARDRVDRRAARAVLPLGARVPRSVLRRTRRAARRRRLRRRDRQSAVGGRARAHGLQPRIRLLRAPGPRAREPVPAVRRAHAPARRAGRAGSAC